ncbi:MAG: nucleotidyltransferase domain-containing protein [Spirochaetes bacterium]|nr:nucleotidyltransferase domain-containing protein [Spirochaetota bacterium]
MNKIIMTQKERIISLCSGKPISKLWVFGSANTDRFSADSDIDFLVSFQDIDEIRYADEYFDLCDGLEQIFNRKIDLITDKSLSNPYFVKSILDTRELIYEQ